jgi:hypothetical protein
MGGLFLAIILLLLVSYLIRPQWIGTNPSFSNSYNSGVAFRIIGTSAYTYYAFNLSGGSVDAFIYDNYAERFAEYFVQGDFSPFTDKNLWRNGQLFYTNFVAYPAAFFMIITGHNLFGVYLLFSLVCFVGLVLILKSFAQNYSGLNFTKASLVIFLFPALWFWTSTIGKDAFMFLGIGLVCIGIRDNKLSWISIIAGLAIIYAFRPPTAYMVLIALSAFFIFNIRDSLFSKLFKITAGVLILVYLMNYLAAEWGIEDFSQETIAELQSGALRNNNFGTGALEEKSGGIAAIPRGIVDVLARPFLWEANNILNLASALEINFVLLVLFLNRKSVGKFFRESLKKRLSTFVIAFLIIYVLSVGIFENNIGLIARHRALIFPFMFLLAYAYAFDPSPRQPSTKPVLKPTGRNGKPITT